MAIKNDDLSKLADLIYENIKEEFHIKHLSGNLVKTISIERMGGEIKIHIPAKTYNMLKYLREGVVVYTSHGSYASKLDEVGSEFYIYTKKGSGRKGSFRVQPHNHKGFIDRAINKAIAQWGAGKKYKVEG